MFFFTEIRSSLDTWFRRNSIQSLYFIIGNLSYQKKKKNNLEFRNRACLQYCKIAYVWKVHSQMISTNTEGSLYSCPHFSKLRIFVYFCANFQVSFKNLTYLRVEGTEQPPFYVSHKCLFYGQVSCQAQNEFCGTYQGMFGMVYFITLLIWIIS